ncbi:MAG: DUF29 domain-containing protein, partial [Dolichospermum sp.]
MTKRTIFANIKLGEFISLIKLREMSTILYDSDFDLWIEQTIQQLKDRQFERLDVEHLIEELQDLGKSEKRALESNLMVLLAHLLKLKIQGDAPDTMTGSWYDSINEHQQRVQKSLRDTPSLNSYLSTAVSSVYPDAR